MPMPVFKRPEAEIYHGVYGSGHPLLLFAAGGLRSELAVWHHRPANLTAIRRVTDLLTRHTP
jgi:hypothetical protein